MRVWPEDTKGHFQNFWMIDGVGERWEQVLTSDWQSQALCGYGCVQYLSQIFPSLPVENNLSFHYCFVVMWC